MRLKVIACKVMMRELYSLAAQCPNIIDIAWKRRGLHDTPALLFSEVQAAIDAVEQEEETYDAILLGYGLCCNGIVGLKSNRYPLVIPRGHDCISFILGSKERYKEIFDLHGGGIYWYSNGWIEHSLMPGRQRYEETYRAYQEKYGEDNAAYLMEMEQNWMKEYSCAYYVDWPILYSQPHADYTRECAEYLHWSFCTEQGSPELMKAMLDGDWDEERFLVLAPNESVEPSYDDSVIRKARK